jgi:NAD(P)-dependent dehydrogenase (short-subunit alcohol dehydrogenase family)
VNAKFKAFDQTRFDRDLEIQVHSAVRICRAVLPAMAKARFGRVLFIQTSYTIGCPPKNTAAYVMAKSAIGGLVKSLAVEYARFGVTVNVGHEVIAAFLDNLDVLGLRKGFYYYLTGVARSAHGDIQHRMHRFTTGC